MESVENLIGLGIVVLTIGFILVLIYSNLKAHSRSANLESKSILDGEKRIHEVNNMLPINDVVDRANKRGKTRQNCKKR